MDNNDNGLWIFGYGSLCWHPGFEYNKSTTGFVKGFSRRFWQGNATHRGTAEKPGRVATLVEQKESLVYGRAFQVKDGTALPYLKKRECSMGGYLTTISTFHTRDGSKCFPVIIYIATKENQHWLGEAPLRTIAKQITECSGPSGHNVEYLLRLAEFMHNYMPEAQDEHLFTLELLVRSTIKEKNMCLTTLMGNRDFIIDLETVEQDRFEADRDNANLQNNVNRDMENTFQYASRVPAQTLRCLKM
ncbi:hypothetical protein KPH14_006671 [Odynerus spinipes]|uniref:glutathione-specific gamma-glutamylcyclotransferase n=1 Tax=Odynerus spinipes TaxID=1348599 RepID=A0AAD9RR16_9HYME|nr:hypothetical protein KPH14_006671 [Odynerus spinipes]